MQKRGPIRQLTPAEVEDLENAATSVENFEAGYMDRRVSDLSSKVAAEGEELLAATYRFIAGVLRPRVEELSRIASSSNQFWVFPASLSADEVQLLADLTSTVRDPELRARFADFLWLHSGDRKYAEIAVDEYLASALRLRDPEKWTGCAARYERAVSVAASLAKKNARYLQAIETVEKYLAELDGTDPRFLSERLMSILLEQKQGDRARYVALADKCARAAERRDNFDAALRYWNVKLRWLKAMNDREGERQARIEAAECVVRDAESRTVGEGSSFLTASVLLQRGIAMLQKAGAPQERITELAVRLKEYELLGRKELKPLRAPRFDASEMMSEARSAVGGKSLDDAILAFVELLHLRPRDVVKAEVLQRAKAFPFMHLFGEVKLNQGGAAIAGRGSVSGDEEEESDNVLALMYQDAVTDFSLQAQVTVEPAWRQIQDEHSIREQDMFVLANASWFVPPSREPFFAKGLAAGFNGELMTAIHLLVPQIEPALRWHLQRLGVNTMRLNRNGYQEERDLNQLLALPETRKSLGDKVHFALTAILTSRFGANLRNDLAHGLIESRECYSVIALFFWTLVLLVCVRTLPKQDSAAAGTE
ncbi:MAG TPA: DUF4209 domain-containing protein [Thermoanaerobaculia bacterium]|nr:DUF4209 domain-containing protein [Thermoanaerobaculia bacterium]